MIEIDTIKANLRISHSLDDELIEMYIDWAKDTVISSVSTSDNINMDYLKSNKQYQKAVIMLTSYYYENRLAISELDQSNMPFGVLDAIQKLRGDHKIEVSNDEI